MKFYCIRKKDYVEVPDKSCTKIRIERRGGITYAVRAVDKEGNKLTRFVAKTAWDALKCKEA